jgi:preprotein translocase subunit YajC
VGVNPNAAILLDIDLFGGRDYMGRPWQRVIAFTREVGIVRRPARLRGTYREYAMFISEAWAQAGGGGGGDMFTAMLPLVLIFAVFYFLLIRPQQKKVKVHQQMIAGLRRGDKIITAGGIYGAVTKVLNEAEAMVEIAEGVRVRIARSTIATLLTKPDPARAANDSQPAPQSGGLIGKFLGRK